MWPTCHQTIACKHNSAYLSQTWDADTAPPDLLLPKQLSAITQRYFNCFTDSDFLWCRFQRCGKNSTLDTRLPEACDNMFKTKIFHGALDKNEVVYHHSWQSDTSSHLQFAALFSKTHKLLKMTHFAVFSRKTLLKDGLPSTRVLIKLYSD